MPEHDFWLSDAQFARLQLLLPNKMRGILVSDGLRGVSRLGQPSSDLSGAPRASCPGVVAAPSSRPC